MALVLAVSGIYGVLSYAVAQRTREFGIRSALGSTPATTLALVTREGLRLIGIGVALGLAGSMAATRLLSAMLYGVSPLDRATWAATTAALMVVGLIGHAPTRISGNARGPVARDQGGLILRIESMTSGAHGRVC